MQETLDIQTYGEEETAKILGLSVKTLQFWRWTKKGPAYVKVGRKVRYTREAIERYLKKNTIEGIEPYDSKGELA